MKLKRRPIAAKYAEVIDSMYATAAQPPDFIHISYQPQTLESGETRREADAAAAAHPQGRLIRP
jgi:hypothetical protein